MGERVESGTPAVVRAIDLERGESELELDEPVKEEDGRRVPPRGLEDIG